MITLLRKMIVPILSLFLLLFAVLHIDSWSDSIAQFWVQETTVIVPPKNEYSRDLSFQFVSLTENFIPYSKGDIRNIFYTIVNNGWEEFTFYCPSVYSNCLSDMKEISKDQDLLTHINNFVHPFHGFSNIQTIIRESGEIYIQIDYLYSKEDMKKIEDKVNRLYSTIVDDEMTAYDKILEIHDYILQNTKYDIRRNNEQTSDYYSYTAYGPLFEGYATCNGYTDAMALFLEKMNIPNFKVAKTPNEDNSEGHVWNAVYLDGEWLHLDLTWDDPVSSDGKDYIQHKYFLITTEQLKEIDSGDIVVTEHEFKPSIYLELK